MIRPVSFRICIISSSLLHFPFMLSFCYRSAVSYLFSITLTRSTIYVCFLYERLKILNSCAQQYAHIEDSIALKTFQSFVCSTGLYQVNSRLEITPSVVGLVNCHFQHLCEKCLPFFPGYQVLLLFLPCELCLLWHDPRYHCISSLCASWTQVSRSTQSGWWTLLLFSTHCLTTCSSYLPACQVVWCSQISGPILLASDWRELHQFLAATL